MPANLNDLLDWFDQAGVVVNDPSIMESGSVEFKDGVVDLRAKFKPTAVPWPTGLKDCKLEWTRMTGM